MTALLAAVDGNLLQRRRRYRRDETAGRRVGKTVTVQRLVVLIDVVAEFDGAVVPHPAGEIDPGHRNLVRQVDHLADARSDAGVDRGAIPARRTVLEDPGG